MATGPLAGIRVLEFSIVLSGPFAGMQLADMGADVIKVEHAPGDQQRYYPGGLPGASKFFQVLNRGRRALTLDLSLPVGQGIIHRLMPSVDVVLINYRPGVANRLGIDYETLRRFRPDLIYAEISGYGAEGPMAHLAASDMTATAHAGVLPLTNAYEEDGSPRSLNPPIAGDEPTGLASAMGILAALYHRERTGEGQLVRTSLLRTAMMMTCWYNSTDPIQDPNSRDLMIAAMQRVRDEGGSYEELIRARRGVRGAALYFRAYRAKDGGLAVGALTRENRTAIRRVLGLAGEDQDDPSFDAAAPSAGEFLQARQQEIQQVLLTRTVADWVERFQQAGAPVGPVLFPEELVDDPQASLHYVPVEHPLSGTTRQVAPVVEMSATPTGVSRHAPLLGEHTVEILRTGGYSDHEIKELRDQQVIYVMD